MTEASSDHPQITVLGIGNILLTDEGFGVRVIEKLFDEYEFPDNVAVVEGGVLGIHLLGTLSKTDHLIVVDAVKNKQPPGTLYRMEKEELPERIVMKNSLHQTDFLETLTLCEMIDKAPQTIVVLGAEPEDIVTHSVELTPVVAGQVDETVARVLGELDRLGVSYAKRRA
ncbi:MAG: HyaD/HybD family hydrogenase maturation endopeptidase [Desulfobacterales bacterium]|nr:HyaD/HybD family hydrogenase maturation endopeptidase [Desulfobacterales bacterium]MDJ0990515.1 HyaD/HybD family hydrogenase maturation endopeptidase [Desulfobacterales bacterium]